MLGKDLSSGMYQLYTTHHYCRLLMLFTRNVLQWRPQTHLLPHQDRRRILSSCETYVEQRREIGNSSQWTALVGFDRCDGICGRGMGKAEPLNAFLGSCCWQAINSGTDMHIIQQRSFVVVKREHLLWFLLFLWKG